MCIVPVKIKKKDCVNEVQTHALVDSCSQGISILNKLVKENQEHKWRTHQYFSGNTRSQVVNINNVKVGWIDLPKTYTKPDLPVDNADITAISLETMEIFGPYSKSVKWGR